MNNGIDLILSLLIHYNPTETINNTPPTISSNSDNFSYFTQRLGSLNNPLSLGSGTLSNGIEI